VPQGAQREAESLRAQHEGQAQAAQQQHSARLAEQEVRAQSSLSYVPAPHDGPLASLLRRLPVRSPRVAKPGGARRKAELATM
jgi:hypothetical protein